ASGGQVIAQDTTGEVPTAGIQIGRDRMRLAVVSLPDAGAIVLTTLRADQRDYDAALASARENIQLNGNGLFGGADVTPPATETSPVTTGTATAATPATGTVTATEAPSATAPVEATV